MINLVSSVTSLHFILFCIVLHHSVSLLTNVACTYCMTIASVWNRNYTSAFTMVLLPITLPTFSSRCGQDRYRILFTSGYPKRDHKRRRRMIPKRAGGTSDAASSAPSSASKSVYYSSHLPTHGCLWVLLGQSLREEMQILPLPILLICTLHL